MGKRGESWLVVVLVVLLGGALFPSVSALGNCLYGSDVVEVTNPLDTIVVDFGEPVDVDITGDDIQFTFYPDSGDSANFETSEVKSLELVSSENDQIYKFKPVEEYTEKFRYSLFVRGYTKTEGSEGVLLEQCKYIYVDYGPLTIEKIKPTQKYISDPAPKLEFSTNRKSECRISTSTETFDSMSATLMSPDKYIHSGNYPGSDTFWVACKDINDEIISKSFSLTIDLTKPLAPIIDDSSDILDYPDRTNSVSLLRAKFTSEDLESGIAVINYTVADKETGIYVTDWRSTTKVDEWIAIGDLSLINGKEYMIVAFAKNKAGLVSEQSSSDGILVDSLFDSNNLCPTVFCTNGIFDDGEAFLDCGGLCPGCGIGHECGEDKDCSTNFCNDDTLLCALPTCDDGYMNGVESDIDCGGTCNETCSLGLMCNDDSDCSTNYCLGGTCSQANCFDNVKNGEESDIDCGGTCDTGCPADRRCNENTDCISQECDSFLKTCIGPSAETETKQSSGNSGLWILLIVSSVVIIGGGSYYLISTGKVKMPFLSGNSSATTHSSASTSKPVTTPKPQPIQTGQAKQSIPAAKPKSTIDTSLLAAKLRKNLNKKEDSRELNSLFGEFKNAQNTTFESKSEPGKDDGKMVTKEEINDLFGDVSSKSALDKLSLQKKK